MIHAAGGYTAWSDKHPSYSSVNGPGNGTNVDDYYSPEINSIPVTSARREARARSAAIRCPIRPRCLRRIPGPTASRILQCYDTLKVNAILNEINGKTHNGSAAAPVPAVFGMNFQAVSVGQKLIEKIAQPDRNRRLFGRAGNAHRGAASRNRVRRRFHRQRWLQHSKTNGL